MSDTLQVALQIITLISVLAIAAATVHLLMFRLAKLEKEIENGVKGKLEVIDKRLVAIETSWTMARELFNDRKRESP